ncbi:MAG: two-component system LytT family response regulator [Maribacter sp.]|jgi:two-component system LytT family response regulator
MLKTINCLIIDDEPTAREILENHLGKIDFVKVVASCSSPMKGLSIIKTQPIDLVFLDINMPEMSGLSFAKSVGKNVKIIFTTAYREYAIDGFDLQAVDYLLKPISLERLIQGLNKFIDESIPVVEKETKEIKTETTDFIFVRSNRKMIKINFAEILYIESIADYVKIHQVEKTIITRETITSIEAKLPQSSFMRVHRSFIVSIAKIASFTNEFVELTNKVIPISRGYKKEVLERLEGM